MARFCRLLGYLLVFIIELHRSLCDQPSTLLCAIDGYDYLNLTTVNWFIDLDQQYCLFKNQTQCTLELAICHTIGNPGLCESSSVCSVSGKEYLSLGAYRENPLGPLVEGFQAVFSDGSQYITDSGFPCLLQTHLAFICSKSTIWESPGSSELRKKAPVPKLVSYNNKTCQLSLTFDYAGACKREMSAIANLSPGTILVVIFFVAVILYFVFGAMINLARGYVGSDVVPHGRFWSMLPIYIFDGFQFVFSCGRLPVTSTYEQI
ncbi:unnamed protein product [Candidula unifasciata]|uniref:Autophagy-related protein 27 n=1 Tax=Candidula unifasciata TaxID=100452 RepID=A0A8S3YS94_9EUPU|nr:unnamed protein product [Candidula unifasciata]